MDFLNSFFQNIKDKLTSPFFGTLTFIIIIHHWEFWYTLFNFDKDCTRTEKIATLRLIALNEFGGWSLFHDIIIAIIIMLIGYGIVMATKTLSLAIDFRFMPWITGKVISQNVVERSVHEEIVRERDEYSEKYEEQRKSVRLLSKDFDTQTAQIQTKNDSITQQQSQINHLQKANSSLESDLGSEKYAVKNLRESKQSLEDEVTRLNAILDNRASRINSMQENQDNLLKLLLDPDIHREGFRMTPYVVVKKSDEMKKAGDWTNFLSYIDFERNGGTIDGSVVNRMQELGIAGGDRSERITPLGQYLAAYANNL